MAVQKSRKTRSRRGMRRSHDALSTRAISVDPMTGEAYLRHNIAPDGSYRGRQIIVEKVEEESDDEAVGES